MHPTPLLPNVTLFRRKAEREEILRRKLEEQHKLREACDQVFWSSSLNLRTTIQGQ